MTPSEIEARRRQLQAAVRGHKAAIRRHRDLLVQSKRALVALDSPGGASSAPPQAQEMLHGHRTSTEL